jgi:O-antigen/teichoic acid export membrane protein
LGIGHSTHSRSCRVPSAFNPQTGGVSILRVSWGRLANGRRSIVIDRRMRLRASEGPRTASNVVTVGGGKALHAAAGFGVGVLLARALGPSGFGLYSLGVAVTTLGQETCGYGLETALVRHASPLWGTDNQAAWRLCSALLHLKALVAGALVVLGLPLVWGVGVSLFREPLAVFAISMGLIGTLTTSVWRGSLAIFQSRQQFGFHAVAQGSSNVLKLAGVGVILALGTLRLGQALALHVLCPAAVFALAVVPFAGHLALARREMPEAARTLFHIGRWLVVSSLLFAAHYRADVLMLSALSSSAAVGIYNAAFVLASAVDFATLSLDTVLLPKYSAVPMEVSLDSIARRTALRLLALALGLIPLALLARPLALLLFGEAFGPSALVLQLLIPGVAATLVTQPFLVAFYTRGNIRSLVPLDAVVLALNLVANAFLIPRYGAPGAAVATSLARVMRAGLVVRLASRT